MKRFRKLIIALAVFFAFASIACAQGYDGTIENARAAYRDESFEKAFAYIADGIPETISDSAVKKRTADFLSGIGVQEYDIKNFKNAYDAFRKSLKYDPTNAQSTSYFIKMRRESDVTALRNEAPPRTKPIISPAASETPVTAAAGSVLGTAPAPSGVSNVELAELKGALEDAGTRLKTMESSVSSTSEENKILKAQVDQQLALIQTFIEKQATVSSAAPSIDPAAYESAAQEKALVAKTMELLAKMSEQETAPRQIVVQNDPALKEFVEKLATTQQALGDNRYQNLIVVIAVATIGAGILVLGVILLIGAARSRRRKAQQYEQRPDSGAIPANMTAGRSYAAMGQSGGNTPLLGFIESAPQENNGKDFAIRKDLLKAERFNRMFEEVRSGTLSWNTVRQYIGELEVSLKMEILKVVERKLDEGDLVSPEAILPVIFPFLTDYDDFIRDKSENLARRALVDMRKTGNGAGGEEPETDQDSDPLSIRNLMDIPKKLQSILKSHDQTLTIAKICRGMGAVLGLSMEERNLLYKTALAHDCGYLMLDRDRLSRTISKQEIDEEDFAFIQTHATQGPYYFGDIDLPEQFKGGILSHHERNDGSGYPDGLKKEGIPLYAKILGVAETFTALISKRSYRDKRDVTQALAIISDGAKAKFDSAHVEALAKVASSIEVV